MEIVAGCGYNHAVTARNPAWPGPSSYHRPPCEVLSS
ncbi:hypothetical protein DFR34_1084 [Rivihabitans pingtungensis]|uniref:Uncharacterized protein n=1 Tax=Rivihabitans pingtungensis TaxID=1054498 RepID=A0A318KM61_9NEIS|nr:hypothetical protein DFR34_1084 [Rivihabitans pingtungensis]